MDEHEQPAPSEERATPVGVSFRYRRTDGTVYERFLEGEAAGRFQEMLGDACLFLDVHSCNPDWSSLPWVERDVARL